MNMSEIGGGKKRNRQTKSLYLFLKDFLCFRVSLYLFLKDFLCFRVSLYLFLKDFLCFRVSLYLFLKDFLCPRARKYIQAHGPPAHVPRVRFEKSLFISERLFVPQGMKIHTGARPTRSCAK
jgi:hypothetical protein